MKRALAGLALLGALLIAVPQSIRHLTSFDCSIDIGAGPDASYSTPSVSCWRDKHIAPQAQGIYSDGMWSP